MMIIVQTNDYNNNMLCAQGGRILRGCRIRSKVNNELRKIKSYKHLHSMHKHIHNKMYVFFRFYINFFFWHHHRPPRLSNRVITMRRRKPCHCHVRISQRYRTLHDACECTYFLKKNSSTILLEPNNTVICTEYTRRVVKIY